MYESKLYIQYTLGFGALICKSMVETLKFPQFIFYCIVFSRKKSILNGFPGRNSII